ncbi:MAG TPA: universal stress protein [Polyangia bacterium]
MLDRRPLEAILVPVDFSTGARRALERACRLPLAPGARLTLLHVMPKVHPSFFARAEAAARAALEAWAQAARAELPSAVEVVIALEQGEPFVEIDRVAHAARAELVVVGRHGARAWPSALLGSTAERVLRHGRTPVLVVGDPRLQPYRRPLVGVDEDNSATVAIERMARVVAPQVRGALAIHVVDLDPFAALAQYGLSDDEIDRVRRAQLAESRQKIERALDDLGATELDFDVRFVEGHPRTVLLATARAEGADLVAVGTHGRTGFRHLVFGSVAEAVIRNAPVDVLVARAPLA